MEKLETRVDKVESKQHSLRKSNESSFEQINTCLKKGKIQSDHVCKNCTIPLKAKKKGIWVCENECQLS